jgi:hypothetical protein
MPKLQRTVLALLNTEMHTTGTMSDDQFTQINGSITQLGTAFTKLFKEMQRIEAKLDTKADAEELHRVYNLLDGLAKRISNDDDERVAMGRQLSRHDNQIGQLAEHTGTTLRYE